MKLFQDSSDPVISEIVPLAADPNMRRVRVGKKTVATLRTADIEALGLTAGKLWTAKLAETAQVEIAANKARKAAMNMLGRRAFSKAEVVDRLVRKGHATSIAQRIANELAADRWIDDDAYGRAIVEEIKRKKPAGRRLLESKLEAHKIDREISDRIARDATKNSEPLNEALQLARQRYESMTSLSKTSARRRLVGVLGRRGFDDEIIAAALARLRLGEDDLSNRDGESSLD